MNSANASQFTPDLAAVFACANSLWEACRNEAERNPTLDLSAAYSGWDQLMREVMRIGELFETWACENIDFEETNEVWPYYLGDNFGVTCLSVVYVSELAGFKHLECFRVALRLKLPVRLTVNLPVTVRFEARRPVPDSHFVAYRIQAMRLPRSGDDVVPFNALDDPFDEQFDFPFFGLYAVYRNGLSEHIADRSTLDGAMRLAKNLVPELKFREVAHA